jgi:hypothetical protein
MFFSLFPQQIVLNSLQKYEPRLHIVEVGVGNQRCVSTHPLADTQFIAVTLSERGGSFRFSS